MLSEHYLSDDQDPKTAEKVLGKLGDMLTSGEAVIYLAIQKKPAVTLIPDCIAVTNKRIVCCIPENLGLTTHYIIFTLKKVKIQALITYPKFRLENCFNSAMSRLKSINQYLQDQKLHQ